MLQRPAAKHYLQVMEQTAKEKILKDFFFLPKENRPVLFNTCLSKVPLARTLSLEVPPELTGVNLFSVTVGRSHCSLRQWVLCVPHNTTQYPTDGTCATG